MNPVLQWPINTLSHGFSVTYHSAGFDSTLQAVWSLPGGGEASRSSGETPPTLSAREPQLTTGGPPPPPFTAAVAARGHRRAHAQCRSDGDCNARRRRKPARREEFFMERRGASTLGTLKSAARAKRPHAGGRRDFAGSTTPGRIGSS